MGSAEEVRRTGIRSRNAGIAHQARRHHFDSETNVPFLCECDDELCDENVLLSLAEYHTLTTRAHFVVTPRHAIGDAEWLMVTSRYALFRFGA